MNFSDRSNARKLTIYPEPLIIRPRLNHKQTFIILHGRGSHADVFGPSLLSTTLPNGETLQSSFPHAKFVFPNASKRRAVSFNRSVINQWFDNYSPLSVGEQSKKNELQFAGLRETSKLLHTLLEQEIALVGTSNVVLGGLSQGCAAALIALLTWKGEGLGGAFGMCGWLPLRKVMEDVVRLASPNDDIEGQFDDVFERETGYGDMVSNAATESIIALHEEIQMELADSLTPSMGFQNTPLFISHGQEDEKVPIGLGREAVGCLEILGMDVRWSDYEGLGHWYSSKMLGDLVSFLQEKCGDGRKRLEGREEGKHGQDEAPD